MGLEAELKPARPVVAEAVWSAGRPAKWAAMPWWRMDEPLGARLKLSIDGGQHERPDGDSHNQPEAAEQDRQCQNVQRDQLVADRPARSRPDPKPTSLR
jgi:hypothetical protein